MIVDIMHVIHHHNHNVAIGVLQETNQIIEIVPRLYKKILIVKDLLHASKMMGISQMLIMRKIHKVIIIKRHLQLVLRIVVSLSQEKFVMNLIIANLHVEDDMVAIIIDHRTTPQVDQDQEDLQHMTKNNSQVDTPINHIIIVNQDSKAAIQHLLSAAVAIQHQPLILERNVSILERIYLIFHLL